MFVMLENAIGYFLLFRIVSFFFLSCISKVFNVIHFTFIPFHFEKSNYAHFDFALKLC
jgi:hypothetical protein